MLIQTLGTGGSVVCWYRHWVLVCLFNTVWHSFQARISQLIFLNNFLTRKKMILCFSFKLSALYFQD